MRYSLIDKIKLFFHSLNVKMIKGSFLKYIFTRLENSFRQRLKLKPKKRKSQTMIIKNSLATFKINMADDTFGKSTPVFEYFLHHWIPKQNKIFIDIGANVGFY